MLEEKTLTPETSQAFIDAYKSEAEGRYALDLIQQISDDFDLREKQSLVFNGLSYSQAYEYNQKKGINYSPAKNTNDDRQISMGMVHEKIIAFAAIFLKYVFKRTFECYDEKGKLIRGMGKIYDLSVEFSHQLELFSQKVALVYWEVFTQGNAFVLEDWEVKTTNFPKAFYTKDGSKVLVTPDNMDYTYEFLDGLNYEKGKDVQLRRAISRVLDGRQVIFGNPEIEDLQEQPRITLEEEISSKDAELIYGTLIRWDNVPEDKDKITTFAGEKNTLFGATRHKDPKKTKIIHRVFDKENNRFNIFINGLMMLPSKTPMTIFYPRGNYPISNVPAERLRGSIYSRSVPAKTKFNADFIDWTLKMLANKFEQGIDPAILAHGKYTLTRQIFKGGQVTHGVKKDDYEKADPDNKGVTNNEVSFVTLLKDIIESQTVNPTTAGELSANATATEISVVENNQREQLGYLLDGLVNGFMDMALRRAETIESKYTIKQRETIVDGKKISVYQNFTVSVGGVESVVEFDEEVGSENYDTEGNRNKLFTKSFNEKKKGYQTEYYLANPILIREKKYNLIVKIKPERVKDTQLQMIQMWDEFRNLVAMFGSSINIQDLQKEYLQLSGKPDTIFQNQQFQQAEIEMEAQNMGSFGKPSEKTMKPTMKDATAMLRGTKR